MTLGYFSFIVLCLLATRAVAQEDEQPAPLAIPQTPVEQPSTRPSWIPFEYCRKTTGGEPFDCGAVAFVPLGQTQRIAVRKLLCTPRRADDCAPVASDQFVDVTVLEIERNAVGEIYEGPREEAVVARMRVLYVDGPNDLRTGTPRGLSPSAVFDASKGWVTSDGVVGRPLKGGVHRPRIELPGQDLRPGQSAEGAIGGYVPAGAADIAMLIRQGEYDYVLFGSQP